MSESVAGDVLPTDGLAVGELTTVLHQLHREVVGDVAAGICGNLHGSALRVREPVLLELRGLLVVVHAEGGLAGGGVCVEQPHTVVELVGGGAHGRHIAQGDDQIGHDERASTAVDEGTAMHLTWCSVGVDGPAVDRVGLIAGEFLAIDDDDIVRKVGTGEAIAFGVLFAGREEECGREEEQ